MSLTFIHKTTAKMYDFAKSKKIKPSPVGFDKMKRIPDGVAESGKRSVIKVLDQKYFLKEIKKSMPPPEGSILVPGLHYIGCGYDIFGSYADEDGLLKRLIDPDKIDKWETTDHCGNCYYHYPFVEILKLTKALSKTFKGETLDKMCKKISSDTSISASFCGFYGSVNLNTYSEISKSFYHQWYRKVALTHKWRLVLNNPAKLRKYLYDDVIKAIDIGDPKKLFDQYGLYFTTGIILGGRFTYTSAVDTYEWYDLSKINSAVKAGYSFFVKGETDITSTEEYKKYESSSEIEIETVGGSANKGGDSIINHKTYQDWKKTIKGENISLIGFSNGGLAPIWILAGNKTRRDLLEKEAAVYAKNQSEDLSYTPLGESKAIDYEIKIKTKDEKNAGTDVKVLAQLYGVDRAGNSHNGNWEVLDTKKNDRERGHIDTYTLKNCRDLGKLTYIKIEHTENKDKWLFEWIEVKNLHNRAVYVVRNNNKWLQNEKKIFKLSKKN